MLVWARGREAVWVVVRSSVLGLVQLFWKVGLDRSFGLCLGSGCEPFGLEIQFQHGAG